MVHVQVPIPFGGESQEQAFSAQPPNTSADLLNCRPYDPVTWRKRLSKREGTTKFNSSRLSNDPVRFMAQIVTDGRKNTYTASSGSTETSITTSRVQESRGGCLDRQGNFYCLDGVSNISKYNVDGNLVWTFQPPIAESGQSLCIPFVDALDNLYVGVQSGGTQATAKVWRFMQDNGSAVPVKQWDVTPGAYIRRVLVKGDTIYLALNYSDRYGAYVVAYTGALNTGLTESWRTPVAYPVNDLVLKPDGALLGCSLPFASRGTDPRYPNFTRKTIDAKFRDVLPDFDRRVWRLNTPKSLVGVLANNDAISLVSDDSGKERTLFTSLRSGATQPKFRTEGAGGNPSIYFRGERTVGAGVPATFRDELQTQISASTSTAYADGSQGFLPNYIGAKSCLFLLMRVEEGGGVINSAFGQPRATASVATTGTLFFNRDDSTAYAAGIGTWDEGVDVAGVGVGVGTRPRQFTYAAASTATTGVANTTGMVLITLVSDGGDVQGGEAGDGPTITHSLLRYNGQPIDRWISATSSSTDAAYVGDSHSATGGEFSFRGELVSAFVLRDYANAPMGLISHPIYPHKVRVAGNNPTTGGRPVAYSTSTAFNATEMEKIEGIIMHEAGCAHLLPRAFQSGGAYIAEVNGGAAPFTPTTIGNYPHPYSLATAGGGGGAFTAWNGPPRATNAGRSEPFLMHSPQGVAWKLDAAKGELQWCVTSTTGLEGGGGVGYSIACSADGTIIYSAGPPLGSVTATWDGRNTSTLETDSTILRAWVDKNGTKVDGYNTSTVIGQKAWIVQNQITFTGSNWTNGTLTITGTFTGYVFQSGDKVSLTAGTGVTLGTYSIASGNTTTLVLQAGDGVSAFSTGDINGAGGDIVDNSIQGRILPAWTTTDIKIGVDSNDNVHAPWAFASGTAATVKIYAREPDGSGASNVGRLLLSYNDATSPKGYCAVPVPSPDYRRGTVPPADFERNPGTSSTVDKFARAELTWICVAQTGALPNTTAGVLKIRLVTALPTGGPPRIQTLVQVVNGVVAKFTTSTMPAFAGPSTLATPQLSTASTYIAGAVAFNKLFLTDGAKYIYVDPINDTVLNYKATDGGKIPERCKLMVNWRGRIVVARGVDSPQSWTMSELGNPFGWNQFPEPRIRTRAISGVNAPIGLAPDDINCLIPYTDNVLIFGCDSTIWAMVGDPADDGAAAGFRQVSRTTGMAFGRPWCIDPEGRIYFFGTRGGVYTMTVGSEPESISDDTIDALLRSTDLGTYRVEMSWDDDYGVLRLMFAGAATTHYTWHRETKGWWPDSLPYGMETLLVVDGDQSNDRTLIMGCADGYIRRWERTGKNDDGTAITSRFLIGPVTPQDARNKWRFRDFRAQISDSQDSLTMNVYESQTPDTKGTLRLTTVLNPGRNKSRPLSACGPYVWFEGVHSTLDKRWSVESLSVEAWPVGRAHVV